MTLSLVPPALLTFSDVDRSKEVGVVAFWER